MNRLLAKAKKALVVAWSLLFATALLAACAYGRSPRAGLAPEVATSRGTADPNKFAIVVSGVGGEEAYTKRFSSQAMRLCEQLTNHLHFPNGNVYLLTENGAGTAPGADDGFVDEHGPAAAVSTARSTAAEVRNTFARIKAAARPDSLVLIVLIGHGSFDNQQPKFNLVGPDLTAKDYAALVAGLPAKRVVFIDCSSSSGEFIKPLSAEGRVIVTATRSGAEQNATVFAESLVAALTDKDTDTDKDGRLSMLEVFNYATRLTADWFKTKDLLATEHALIDDNGDGTGHESATDGDGELAAITYLDSPTQADGGGTAPDLLAKRQDLEEKIAKLKSRKAEMKPEEYDLALQPLLLELAKVDQAIKARKKQ
ncbi:MAG TPA: hypothetical protein VJX67_03945 [Blastocatellia bacterium]|nr:hypothetical protein [Blastocatellia bacterium]